MTKNENDGTVTDGGVHFAPTNAPVDPDITQDSKDKMAESVRKMNSKRKKLTLGAIALIYFTASAAFSILSPFFPNEAKRKKCSNVLLGLIFGIYPLTVFIMSPIFGILLPYLGPRFTLFAGLFVEGGTQLLFGFVDLMPDGTVFVVFCFLLRVIQAVGSSASETACFATIAGEFPDSISSVVGTMETFAGIGMMVGPPLGGILYQAGGFKLPFLSLGALVLVSLPLIFIILPSYNPNSEGPQAENSQGSILKILFLPNIFIVALSIFVSGSCLGFFDPTLAPFLTDEFGYNSTKIGLVFLLTCGMYALSAPFLGWMADKTNKRVMIIFGLWITALSYVLLGPWPLLVEYLHFPEKAQWLMLLAMGIIGVSVTLALVPVMGDMLDTVRNEGYAEDLSTHGLISGIFNSMFSIGAFIGPTLGSSLTDTYSFAVAASIFGGVIAVQALILTIFTLVKACAKATVGIVKHRRSLTSSTSSAPLIHAVDV